jgi:type VI secretion system secreted protein Hcp
MAAVDYYLKVDGIDGESQDSKHKGEIDVESWSWGESQAGTHAGGGGGGAGKVQMQDFHFVMKINKASPKLMLACATGQHIKKAVLTCRKAGGKQEDFLKVTMSDLLVSSYQTGGSGHSDIVPTDQISLNYSKIEIEYKEQKPDGSLGGTVKAGYDIKQNKQV